MIYKYTIKYIVAIIILNKTTIFRSINNNKNNKIIRGIFSDLHSRKFGKASGGESPQEVLGSSMTGSPLSVFF